MIKDIPNNISETLKIAEQIGLIGYRNFSEQKLIIISPDEIGPVLRFFSPELRPTPLGTEIGGALGIALGDDTGHGVVYSNMIFRNILNDLELLHADRILENRSDTRLFLEAIKARLLDLPCNVHDIVESARTGDGWIAKQLASDSPAVERFKFKLGHLS